MIRRELTNEEMDLARRITRERQENKREYNVASRKIDDNQSENEVMLVGTMGEVAVANEFGFEVNREVSTSGDDGWDVRRGLITAEIKTRRGHEKDFAVYHETGDIEADLAILNWEQNGDIVIVGFVTRAEWLMLAEPIQFGRSARRGVRYQNFRSPDHLHRLLGYNK